MDIPVFHDDQHGTAIIAAAGLINALHLTDRGLKETKLVVNGAGAAGIACIELVKAMGLPQRNVVLCDTKGVVYQGRKEGMNQWKSAHAANTKARTLEEALEGADVFFGLSVAGAVTKAMVKSMADKPIIFAMANPEPEIRPEEVFAVRSDAIVATGRSDYPNQVNNVLGFPYIFRGALDVQARTINEAMKIAAAEALARLARSEVPDEVAAAYGGNRPRYGRDYIIPAPFDPRLISAIPTAVAKAAMDSGVARRTIVDMDGYAARLSARLNPVTGWLQAIFERVRRDPKRVVFAEGEEEQVVRAANTFLNSGLGHPILIGREERMKAAFKDAGVDMRKDFTLVNAQLSEHATEYAEFLYARLQRKGYLYRDCLRLVNTDRNIFGACMVALGHADAMVTGVTRNWSTAYEDIRRVLDAKPGHTPIGVSLVLSRGRVVLVADTSVHDMPTSEQLADIAQQAAIVSRRLGAEPRVAMLAYSTFGHPKGERSERVREAVQLLDARGVDFNYDGEMGADVALNKEALKLYPFCRLKEPANVLVMPAFHSASISTKMLTALGRATVIGPLLVGLAKPVQIVSLGARDTDIVNMAALAAYDISG
jgi:malate dehydrogenase (oxaloacetate-decarboxylating)(NADP+)